MQRNMSSGTVQGVPFIDGNLYFIEGGLADSGPLQGSGYFLAVKFNCESWSDYDDVRVGLDPSAGTGLVSILNDPDKNGVFKVQDSSGELYPQKLVIETTIGEEVNTIECSTTLRFDDEAAPVAIPDSLNFRTVSENGVTTVEVDTDVYEPSPNTDIENLKVDFWYNDAESYVSLILEKEAGSNHIWSATLGSTLDDISDATNISPVDITNVDSNGDIKYIDGVGYKWEVDLDDITVADIKDGIETIESDSYEEIEQPPQIPASFTITAGKNDGNQFIKVEADDEKIQDINKLGIEFEFETGSGAYTYDVLGLQDGQTSGEWVVGAPAMIFSGVTGTDKVRRIVLRNFYYDDEEGEDMLYDQYEWSIESDTLTVADLQETTVADQYSGTLEYHEPALPSKFGIKAFKITDEDDNDDYLKIEAFAPSTGIQPSLANLTFSQCDILVNNSEQNDSATILLNLFPEYDRLRGIYSADNLVDYLSYDVDSITITDNNTGYTWTNTLSGVTVQDLLVAEQSAVECDVYAEAPVDNGD